MAQTMPAAVFLGEGRLEMMDRPVPALQSDDQVLLTVDASSFCGTDLQILKVPPGHPANAGIILGHEYTGTVADCGDRVEGFRKGDRVVVDPNLTCGRCHWCLAGKTNFCERFTTLGIFLDGGFAPFNVAPARALHPAGGLAAEVAMLTEPLACVMHGLSQLDVGPGASALVLGAGPIGLMFTTLLRASGVRPLLVVEPGASRARQAARAGADVVMDPGTGDLSTRVREATGHGADVVIDAVGSQLEPALACVRPGGSVLLFGMNSAARPSLAQSFITRWEIRIVGSYIAPFSFPSAVRALEAGAVDAGALITHRIGLSDLQAGLDALRAGDAVKVVVNPSG